MVDDVRVDEFLEQLLQSGGTPEEVCRHCPELLDAVRAGWQEVRALQAEVDKWFPGSGAVGKLDATIICQAAPSAGGLPHVSGYEVQEELGRGGMGVVYKAWHLRLNRPVALKMLLAGAYAQPQELERFLREAETVAGLHHANIVQVHEAGDVGGRPYFTMEFIEGGSLAQKMAGTPQPARQAAALVALVAEAVHAAHLKGVVHRDLKPGNILLAADGTPKLTDFGLARRLEGTAGLTQSGVPLGTPNYMAPEQAQGKARAVGPATDIYALGAILYELLTGRPPFQAATGAETLQQVVSQDPVIPRRLNPTVPRDLETICVKCLEKEPARRYPSAWAVAEDLHRFLRNEPIKARPVGPLEQVLRWTRRKPTVAGLLAMAVALIGLAIGGGIWLVKQHAERGSELRVEIGTTVDQALKLRQQYHFREARELLEQARQQLALAGPDDLRQQVEQARAALELVENLDRARLGNGNDPLGSIRSHEKILAKAGFSRLGDNGELVGARVRDSAECAEIVAALDDWASRTLDPAQQAWLLAVARKADPDPTRDRQRQPALWQDGPRLTKLVQELRVESLSPQLLTALARVMSRNGGDSVPLLRAAQLRYPGDFWLNWELASVLMLSQQRYDEAIGFYRAALAIRPEVSLLHNNLGFVLGKEGRLDEAMSHLQEAIRLDPKASMAHNNLGFILRGKGQLDEAISHYQEGLRIDPGSALIHNNLGLALRARGRLDEAIRHFQKAIQLDPKTSAMAHSHLGNALHKKGRVDEAIIHYQESIRLDPKWSAVTHHNLGIALHQKGRLEEAISQYQHALQVDPKLAAARSQLYMGQYTAACAAVRASAGQSSPKQVALRRQALDWLRADLELRTRLLNEVKPADLKALKGWSLSGWQTDPALAGVRDEAALTKLPDAERAEWQRLWADVAALRRKAEH